MEDGYDQLQSAESDIVLTRTCAGYTGKGVTIAIVDDGIDQDHPDIQPNFKQAGSYNYNTNSNNTRPVNLGQHGVSCPHTVDSMEFSPVHRIGTARPARVSQQHVMTAKYAALV